MYFRKDTEGVGQPGSMSHPGSGRCRKGRGSGERRESTRRDDPKDADGVSPGREASRGLPLVSQNSPVFTQPQ